jgi:hypothetical protein
LRIHGSWSSAPPPVPNPAPSGDLISAAADAAEPEPRQRAVFPIAPKIQSRADSPSGYPPSKVISELEAGVLDLFHKQRTDAGLSEKDERGSRAERGHGPHQMKDARDRECYRGMAS